VRKNLDINILLDYFDNLATQWVGKVILS
jgi:hypothetical protein